MVADTATPLENGGHEGSHRPMTTQGIPNGSMDLVDCFLQSIVKPPNTMALVVDDDVMTWRITAGEDRWGRLVTKLYSNNTILFQGPVNLTKEAFLRTREIVNQTPVFSFLLVTSLSKKKKNVVMELPAYTSMITFRGLVEEIEGLCDHLLVGPV